MLNPKRYIDGRLWTLKLGEDFPDEKARLIVRQAIYRAARKAGRKIRTRNWPDRMEVQAEPIPAPLEATA